MSALRSQRASIVHVRRATEHDLDAIVTIERASFSDPWTRRAFADLLAPAHVLFLVAEDGDRVSGYVVAWYIVDEAEVANIAVATDARARGVGGVLLDRALEEGRQRGTHAIFLEVRESNGSARALYASRGFVEIGRRPRYYAKPSEDAIVMRASPRGVAPREEQDL